MDKKTGAMAETVAESALESGITDDPACHCVHVATGPSGPNGVDRCQLGLLDRAVAFSELRFRGAAEQRAGDIRAVAVHSGAPIEQ